jgi:hypothetical protein
LSLWWSLWGCVAYVCLLVLNSMICISILRFIHYLTKIGIIFSSSISDLYQISIRWTGFSVNWLWPCCLLNLSYPWLFYSLLLLVHSFVIADLSRNLIPFVFSYSSSDASNKEISILSQSLFNWYTYLSIALFSLEFNAKLNIANTPFSFSFSSHIGLILFLKTFIESIKYFLSLSVWF